MIGIVGGVGPKAGEDLHSKILANTRAGRDADHLSILLYTNPAIPDRTAFILGDIPDNPATEMLCTMRVLAKAGASVLCVPCNTAHSPVIWDSVLAGLPSFAPRAQLLHLIQITTDHLATAFPDAARIGVLATTGTISASVYQSALSSCEMQPIIPDEPLQRAVHETIYHPRWGIKAVSAPVSARAVETLTAAVETLIARGAQAVILGCTELPLALTGSHLDGVPLIDPAHHLAREAIRRVGGEEKLAPDRV
ncbi:MAG: aspartate/glutamate racemase family protein [Armatimonadota bacterium]